MVDGRSANIMPETGSFALDRRSIGKVNLSLDLCQDFMGIVMGHASFPFHISQQLLPNLEGRPISGEKFIKMRQVLFHI